MEIKANTHIIAILCKSCDSNWRLSIPISGNNIESFATICPCGAIIVGNYNYSLDIDSNIDSKFISKNQKYLTNGQFEVLNLSDAKINQLPILELE